MALSGCTGTLPLAWGSLSNLQHLTLHENLLSGAISHDTMIHVLHARLLHSKNEYAGN